MCAQDFKPSVTGPEFLILLFKLCTFCAKNQLLFRILDCFRLNTLFLNHCGFSSLNVMPNEFQNLTHVSFSGNLFETVSGKSFEAFFLCWGRIGVANAMLVVKHLMSSLWQFGTA